MGEPKAWPRRLLWVEGNLRRECSLGGRTFTETTQTFQQEFKLRSHPTQFLSVSRRKRFQELFTASCQSKADHPVIPLVGFPPGQPLCNKTASEFDRAVMADLQALGEFADRDLIPARKPFDGQQRLVLLGRQSGCARAFFAKMKELAQGVAKRSQRLILRLGDFLKGFLFHGSTGFMRQVARDPVRNRVE